MQSAATQPHGRVDCRIGWLRARGGGEAVARGLALATALSLSERSLVAKKMTREDDQAAADAAGVPYNNETTAELQKIAKQPNGGARLRTMMRKKNPPNLYTKMTTTEMITRLVADRPQTARKSAGGNAPRKTNGAPSAAKKEEKQPVGTAMAAADVLPDAALVAEVKEYMKECNLSQVAVGQEVRIAQAVISQWLSQKYHGHNNKVRAPLSRNTALTLCVDLVLCLTLLVLTCTG